MVIRRMSEDLNFPVQIVGAPTVREDDGLAMSSRNGYLTAAERTVAPGLYRTLCEVADRLKRGQRDFARLERDAAAALHEAGLGTDYVSIRRSEDLGEPDPRQARFVVLAAAYLGKARLIDNIEVT